MTEQDFAAAFNENNAPFARMIGVRMIIATKERLEAELRVTPDHCTIPATMHGGAIMAFADNMGGCGAVLNMPEGMMTTTVEQDEFPASGAGRSKGDRGDDAGASRPVAAGLESRNFPRGRQARGDRHADADDPADARVTAAT